MLTAVALVGCVAAVGPIIAHLMSGDAVAVVALEARLGRTRIVGAPLGGLVLAAGAVGVHVAPLEAIDAVLGTGKLVLETRQSGGH